MDHHVHTKLCRHAEGVAEDYVKSAIQKGLSIIGFNEHFPMRYLPDTIPVEEYAMEYEEFPGYIKELKRLREKYAGQIQVKIATEVDYYVPAIDEIKTLLEPFMDDLDYLYGSVHVVDDWAVDDSRFEQHWMAAENDVVYAKYYKNIKSMAQTRIFDVVGHLDLPKKYEHYPSGDRSVLLSLERALNAIADSNMVIEVNTAGLRKPVKELYPSETILKDILNRGIKITLGSDAHHPDEVGYEFDGVIAQLKALGFKTIETFRRRVRTSIEI